MVGHNGSTAWRTSERADPAELVAILALTSVPAMLAVLRALARWGFSCLTCHDVPSLLVTVQACTADLVVVDVRLGGDPLGSVLKCVSPQGLPRVAILGDGAGLPSLDAVEVLDPSWPLELVGAHLRSLLRQERPGSIESDGSPHRLSWGDLLLDRRSRQVFRAGIELHQTRQQFRLLWALCQAEGGVVTVEELSRAVYGERTGNDRERVFAHIRRIRRLIEADPSRPTRLLAVRGEGFRLTDVEDSPSLRVG
jgi:two-component system, OmpR family, response regulator MtrA